MRSYVRARGAQRCVPLSAQRIEREDRPRARHAAQLVRAAVLELQPRADDRPVGRAGGRRSRRAGELRARARRCGPPCRRRRRRSARTRRCASRRAARCRARGRPRRSPARSGARGSARRRTTTRKPSPIVLTSRPSKRSTSCADRGVVGGEQVAPARVAQARGVAGRVDDVGEQDRQQRAAPPAASRRAAGQELLDLGDQRVGVADARQAVDARRARRSRAPGIALGQLARMADVDQPVAVRCRISVGTRTSAVVADVDALQVAARRAGSRAGVADWRSSCRSNRACRASSATLGATCSMLAPVPHALHGRPMRSSRPSRRVGPGHLLVALGRHDRRVQDERERALRVGAPRTRRPAGRRRRRPARRRVAAGGVEHGVEVGDLVVQRQRLVDGVREPEAATIHEDHARDRAQPLPPARAGPAPPAGPRCAT